MIEIIKDYVGYMLVDNAHIKNLVSGEIVRLVCEPPFDYCHRDKLMVDVCDFLQQQMDDGRTIKTDKVIYSSSTEETNEGIYIKEISFQIYCE